MKDWNRPFRPTLRLLQPGYNEIAKTTSLIEVMNDFSINPNYVIRGDVGTVNIYYQCGMNGSHTYKSLYIINCTHFAILSFEIV